MALTIAPPNPLSFIDELPRAAALVVIRYDQPGPRAVGACLISSFVLPGLPANGSWDFQLTRQSAGYGFYMGWVASSASHRRSVYVLLMRDGSLPLPEHPGLIVVDDGFVGDDSPEQAAARLLERILPPLPVAA